MSRFLYHEPVGIEVCHATVKSKTRDTAAEAYSLGSLVLDLAAIARRIEASTPPLLS